MTNQRLIIASLFLLLACGGQEDPSELRIYGGEEFFEDNHPYVNLWREGASRPYCSGVFVRGNIVLTASHCIDFLDAEKILVNQNLRGLASKYTNYKTPDFPVNEQKTFDVGLLKVEGWFDGETVRLPSYGEYSDLRQQSLVLHASGNFDKFDQYSNDLLRSTIRFRMNWGYHGYEFVAGDRNHHTCRGNSGGALMVEQSKVAVGVASRRFAYDIVDNCSSDPAGIFTDLRAPDILHWLNQSIAELEVGQ